MAAVDAEAATFGQRFEAAAAGIGSFLIRVGLLPGLLAGFSLAAGVHFQSAQQHVEAFAGASAADMATLSKAAIGLSTTYGVSATSIVQSSYDVYSAGFQHQKAMDIITASTKAAAAGNMQLDPVVKALTTTMYDYRTSNISAADAMGQMVKIVQLGRGTIDTYANSLATVEPLAGALGVQLSDLGAILVELTRHGNTWQNATQMLSNTLIHAEVPTQKQRVAAAALGLTWQDLALKHGETLIQYLERIDQASHRQVLSADQVREAMGGQARFVDQTVALMKNHNSALATLLGTSIGYKTILEALNGNYRELASLQTQIAGGAGALDKAWAAVGTTSAVQAKRLGEAIRDLAIIIGTALLPMMNALISILLPAVTAFMQFTQAHQTLAAAVVGLGAAFLLLGASIKISMFALGVYKQALDIAGMIAGVVSGNQAAASSTLLFAQSQREASVATELQTALLEQETLALRMLEAQQGQSASAQAAVFAEMEANQAKVAQLVAVQDRLATQTKDLSNARRAMVDTARAQNEAETALIGKETEAAIALEARKQAEVEASILSQEVTAALGDEKRAVEAYTAAAATQQTLEEQRAAFAIVSQKQVTDAITATQLARERAIGSIQGVIDAQSAEANGVTMLGNARRGEADANKAVTDAEKAVAEAKKGSQMANAGLLASLAAISPAAVKSALSFETIGAKLATLGPLLGSVGEAMAGIATGAVAALGSEVVLVAIAVAAVIGYLVILYNRSSDLRAGISALTEALGRFMGAGIFQIGAVFGDINDKLGLTRGVMDDLNAVINSQVLLIQLWGDALGYAGKKLGDFFDMVGKTRGVFSDFGSEIMAVPNLLAHVGAGHDSAAVATARHTAEIKKQTAAIQERNAVEAAEGLGRVGGFAQKAADQSAGAQLASSQGQQATSNFNAMQRLAADALNAYAAQINTTGKAHDLLRQQAIQGANAVNAFQVKLDAATVDIAKHATDATAAIGGLQKGLQDDLQRAINAGARDIYLHGSITRADAEAIARAQQASNKLQEALDAAGQSGKKVGGGFDDLAKAASDLANKSLGDLARAIATHTGNITALAGKAAADQAKSDVFTNAMQKAKDMVAALGATSGQAVDALKSSLDTRLKAATDQATRDLLLHGSVTAADAEALMRAQTASDNFATAANRAAEIAGLSSRNFATYLQAAQGQAKTSAEALAMAMLTGKGNIDALTTAAGQASVIERAATDAQTRAQNTVIALYGTHAQKVALANSLYDKHNSDLSAQIDYDSRHGGVTRADIEALAAHEAATQSVSQAQDRARQQYDIASGQVSKFSVDYANAQKAATIATENAAGSHRRLSTAEQAVVDRSYAMADALDRVKQQEDDRHTKQMIASGALYQQDMNRIDMEHRTQAVQERAQNAYDLAHGTVTQFGLSMKAAQTASSLANERAAESGGHLTAAAIAAADHLHKLQQALTDVEDAEKRRQQLADDRSGRTLTQDIQQAEESHRAKQIQQQADLIVAREFGDFAGILSITKQRLDDAFNKALSKVTLDLYNHSGDLARDSAALVTVGAKRERMQEAEDRANQIALQGAINYAEKVGNLGRAFDLLSQKTSDLTKQTLSDAAGEILLLGHVSTETRTQLMDLANQTYQQAQAQKQAQGIFDQGTIEAARSAGDLATVFDTVGKQIDDRLKTALSEGAGEIVQFGSITAASEQAIRSATDAQYQQAAAMKRATDIQNDEMLRAATAAGDLGAAFTILKQQIGDRATQTMDALSFAIATGVGDVVSLTSQAAAAAVASRDLANAEEEAKVRVAEAIGDWVTALASTKTILDQNLNQSLAKAAYDLLTFGAMTAEDTSAIEANARATAALTAAQQAAQHIADSYKPATYEEVTSASQDRINESLRLVDANTAVIKANSDLEVAGINALATAVADQTAILTAQSGVNKARADGQIKAIQDGVEVWKAQYALSQAVDPLDVQIAQAQLRLAQDKMSSDQREAAAAVATAQAGLQAARDKASEDVAIAAAQQKVLQDGLLVSKLQVKLQQDSLQLAVDHLKILNDIAVAVGAATSADQLIAADQAQINQDNADIAAALQQQAIDQASAAQTDAFAKLEQAYDQQRIAQAKANEEQQQSADALRQAQDQANLDILNELKSNGVTLKDMLAAEQDTADSLKRALFLNNLGLNRFDVSGLSGQDLLSGVSFQTRLSSG